MIRRREDALSSIGSTNDDVVIQCRSISDPHVRDVSFRIAGAQGLTIHLFSIKVPSLPCLSPLNPPILSPCHSLVFLSRQHEPIFCSKYITTSRSSIVQARLRTLVRCEAHLHYQVSIIQNDPSLSTLWLCSAAGIQAWRVAVARWSNWPAHEIGLT